MPFDAVILTGGRSSRLGFTAKSEFLVGQQTLLERTLDAASAARRIVIVGPAPIPGERDARLPAAVAPSSVLRAREDPPFTGPAAGIAAGLAALAADAAAPVDATLVLACDMPGIALAVPVLMDGFRDNPNSDGVLAIDADGRLQPLAAVFRTSSLASAIAASERSGSLAALPMFRLLDGLRLVPIGVPDGATADVDSWDDAQRLGARAPELAAAPELGTPGGEPHE